MSEKTILVCDVCESIVGETAGRFLMGDGVECCSQCYMEWYDPDKKIAPCNSETLGKAVRKKYGRKKWKEEITDIISRNKKVKK